MPIDAKKIAMDCFVKLLESSLLVQHIILAPFIIFSAYYFGFFIVWGSLLVVTISYSVRRVAEHKRVLYDKFMQDSKDKEVVNSEQCEWLNMILRKYFVTCVPTHLDPHIESLQRKLEDAKPSFLHSMTVSKFELGNRPPVINNIVTKYNLPDSSVQLTCHFHFLPSFCMEFKIEPIKRVGVTLLVDSFKFIGNIQVKMELNDVFPNCSTVSLSFMEAPEIEFSIRPMGGADMLSLPGLYDWLQSLMVESIKPLMVWPQELSFTLGGAKLETEIENNRPITHIAVIYSDDKRVPDGYVVLMKSVTGKFPANTNRHAGGKDVYICYKRSVDPKDKPITGICLVSVDHEGISPGELYPEEFEPILETPSGNPANLNTGNEGRPLYLGVYYGAGNPITSLSLVNYTEKEIIPAGFDLNILEVTPQGKLANLNRKNKGNEMYLLYRGGAASPFGYDKLPVDKNCKGTLRVRIIQAAEVKIADVGGTSDPYCEVFVGDPLVKPLEVKTTSVQEKTLTPVWRETFTFSADAKDVLNIHMYDKDLMGSDDRLGRVAIPLKNLVRGKEYVAWFQLQRVSTGKIEIAITALDFGKDPEEFKDEQIELEQIEILEKKGKKYKTVLKPVKAVMDQATAAGEAAAGAFGLLDNRPVAAVNSVPLDMEDTNKIEYINKEGYMEKLPTQTFVLSSGFKRRWFVLQKHKISYFKSQKDKIPSGSMGLKGSTVELDAEHNLITVKSATKTLVLKPPPAERNAWYYAIARNIRVADNEQTMLESDDEGNGSSSEATATQPHPLVYNAHSHAMLLGESEDPAFPDVGSLSSSTSSDPSTPSKRSRLFGRSKKEKEHKDG